MRVEPTSRLRENEKSKKYALEWKLSQITAVKTYCEKFKCLLLISFTTKFWLFNSKFSRS